MPDLGVGRALLLQGPAGPFMKRFGQTLLEAGIRPTKVNFHAGDVFFYSGPDAVAFRGTIHDWPEYVRELMVARKIDGLFVFGDCRPLHLAAIREARELGVRVFALEEGYLRPNWITLEEHGVNGSSKMPRDPDFYRALDLPPVDPPVEVGERWQQMAWYSTLSALAFTHLNQGFPGYVHHRKLNAWFHTFIHVRSVVRKWVYAAREKHLMPHITGALKGRYWFVPLQVHCDFQLRHSPYEDDMLEFVREVAGTFAAYADPDDSIVFKHHPMDRAYIEYDDFFADLAREHGIEDRLYYVHDLHLPTLLESARGTITINSSVGLQSMSHGTPVIALGTAVWDMQGMAFQGTLPEFLEGPGEVDMGLHESFVRYLLHVNQLNGSFYKRLYDGNPIGVRWFPTGPREWERRFGTNVDAIAK